MKPFTIDPDIARAATLPAEVYTDPAWHERQRERVFARSWQFVADTGRVRVPGQVHPFTFLEGTLEEPLLLVRDRDDRLHAMSNVCTHRGTLVCEHPGIETVLRCRYHGRRFHLDGRFQSMPEFDGALGFPSPADDLPHVPHAVVADAFVMAALDPAAALGDMLAPMLARCGHLPWRELVHDPARSRDYLVQANWALYVDNYLEGFHIPYVHAGLAQALDYGAYTSEVFEWCNVQVGVAADGEEAFDLPPGHPDSGRRIAAWYWWLHPNTMFNIYPWGVSVNVVRPLGHARTRVSFLAHVWDAAKLDRGAGAGLDRVEREDEAIVESVQRGTRARLYTRGRYSPSREQGVHHFHRLLARDLRD